MSIFDLDADDVVSCESAQPRTDGAHYFGGQHHAVGEAMSCVAKLSTIKVLPSGWGYGQIRDDNGFTLSVSGNALAGLQQGGTYTFAGRLSPNGKYGPQLKLDSAGLHIPANRPGMLKFLTANYKGLGQKSAEKILAHYEAAGGLEAFRDRLLADPLGFDFSQAGVKRKTSMKGADGPKGLIYIDLATKVGGVDVGDKLLRKLAAHLAEQVGEDAGAVGRAWQIFSTNPFAPIRTLSGYAFKTADALAMKIGFDPRRAERLAALATHAIAEGCVQSGHTYLGHQDFARIIAKLDPAVGVMEAVEAAIAMQEPIVIDDGRFYSQDILEAEMSLAKKIAWREKSFSKSCIFSGTAQELDQAMNEAIEAIGLKRDETQIKAIRGLLTTKATIHSITAGPGCGKTAIMEVVTTVIKDRKKTLHIDGAFVERPMKIGFCAPTGKAAKVLNSRVSRFGLNATTIHSLLGVRAEGGFAHNRFNKLDLDLLVVDETSMVDLLLANALMDAVEPGCHLVFLGDSKQLPSVGPGNVLADLMTLPLNHYRLSQPHRNKGGILDVVNKAGEGEVEFINMEDVRFVPQLPDATEEGILQSVIRMYDDALKSVAGDFTKLGLLIARRKGDAQTPGWNVTYLNAVLRERYNPAPAEIDFGGYASMHRRREVMAATGRIDLLAGEKVPGTRLRSQDRIIVRKNILLGQEPDSEEDKEQVVNGDTGFVGAIWMQGGLLTGVELVLDDGRRVALPSSDTDILDLSYAMTVHAAQGSEYERVIFVCVNGTPGFVHRGIVFTAFSRAKKHLTVLGDIRDVRQVVARPMPHRNSMLVRRFQEELQVE